MEKSEKNDIKINQKCDINLIQSSDVIKDIFSMIFEKTKLSLVIYNKNLQEILGLNIEDYKKISGRYIIIDDNGNGKECLQSQKDCYLKENM